MAWPAFFSEYLSRYTRGPGRALSPFRGSGAREGAVGHHWAAMAARIREMELGLSPLGPRVRAGRLAASDGLSAGPAGAGAVRGAAGQYGRARARERGGRAPKEGAGSRPRAWPRRPQHPDPQPGGSTGTPPVSAPDRRPASRHYPGPSLGRGLDRGLPALPDRRPSLGRRRLARVAGAAGHRGRHSRPEGAREPPAPRPGTVPGAQRRGTGYRRAQARAPRGHPLRPIRTSFLGLSVFGRGLDLAE